MPSRRRALILLVATAACRKSAAPAPSETYALPGFSVAIPGGTLIENDAAKYGEGHYTRGVKGQWVVMVEWQAGALSDGNRASYQEAWKLQLDKPIRVPVPGVESETFPGENRGPARVTFITCGARHIVIAAVSHADVAALHAGVLASFQCTPDPAREPQMRARIDLADRTGWQRMGASDRIVALARDNGARVMMAFYYASQPDRPTLERLVSGYKVELGAGDPSPLRSAAPPLRGWGRTIRCSDDNWLAVVFIESGDGVAERATVDGVRCLRPDEPDVAWPPAPPELQQFAP